MIYKSAKIFQILPTFIFTTFFDFSNDLSHNMSQDIAILLKPNILNKQIISNILFYQHSPPDSQM